MVGSMNDKPGKEMGDPVLKLANKLCDIVS
jgi:hypothetical protein